PVGGTDRDGLRAQRIPVGEAAGATDAGDEDTDGRRGIGRVLVFDLLLAGEDGRLEPALVGRCDGRERARRRARARDADDELTVTAPGARVSRARHRGALVPSEEAEFLAAATTDVALERQRGAPRAADGAGLHPASRAHGAPALQGACRAVVQIARRDGAQP